MTKNELKQAIEIARSDRDLSKVDIQPLVGYGLKHFVPVTVAIEAVAAIIRWDCWLLNGEVDGEALDNLANCFRRKVSVL